MKNYKPWEVKVIKFLDSLIDSIKKSETYKIFIKGLKSTSVTAINVAEKEVIEKLDKEYQKRTVEFKKSTDKLKKSLGEVDDGEKTTFENPEF